MKCRAKPTSRGTAAAAAAVAILCAAVAGSAAAPADGHHQLQQDSVPASVREVPQRPMTVKSGGGGGGDDDPDPFPIGRGEPFVVDPANVPQNHGPIAGFSDTRPLGPRSAAAPSDEYSSYDYADKVEEVPFDYRGDPIDRKDVHPEPGSVRPNDIVKPVNKPQSNNNNNNNNNKLQTPADIYQFLNLPKQYSSSDFKFPLVSSSYANTKVQGSGSSSSSLSNHKMPETTTTPAPTTTTTTASRYNPTTVKTTVKPTTTTTTARPTTTTTTAAPSQEYEEYDYNDYNYNPQEPALSSSTTTTTTTTTTTASTYTPSVYHRNSSSFVTPEPATTATTSVASTAATHSIAPFTSAAEATSPSSTTVETMHRVPYSPSTKSTTTPRPEIDSKLDGTSFADYDTIKPTDDKAHQHYGQQPFKPLPGNYQFDDKTYPLMTNSKVPMTFTAHVSSGISLNQKEHRPTQAPESIVYSSRPSQPEVQDSSGSSLEAYDGNKRLQTSGGSRPNTMITDANSSEPPPYTYSKPKPPRPIAGADQLETVYHKVRPDTYNAPAQQFPSATQNRPVFNQPPAPHVSRPYQPEPPAIKTPMQMDNVMQQIRKPANGDLQGRPAPMQPYPAQSSADVYAKNQPQYVPPTQSPVDTSKFKPPKHVINHFIKTLPDEDNKSYALQTSFSIGMDGERAGAAETRPGQGVGQVLMVKDGSSEAAAVAVEQPMPPKLKPSTTSVPLVPPPRLATKPLQQQYPRPPWENIPKQPSYYPPPQQSSPKRDGPPQPPSQRTGLPNILPQFRPNAKVDAPPMAPQSHSATIERVQIPTDHLRPPPLPKPQFLKMDRNDENVDEEILDIPEKETRILQRTGPQPAKVTTLQMIQHGAPAKTREDGVAKESLVHVVYAASSPPKGLAEKPTDDSGILDVKDRSDVPVLKTKTTAAVGKPARTGDFPYQIVKPDDTQKAPSSLEYQAYSPTKPETSRPNSSQELVPNLQDYVPVVTRDSAPNNGGIGAPAPQRPITATLKTTDDNHRADESQHKPQLQNFQIPFQPSMKLPENTNGWSVVRKSPVDSASDRMDETGDAASSTEKFDPDNFKPHLVGGFMPINSPLDEAKEKNATDHSERA